MAELVFDIETIGDIHNQQSMKITVVSLYDYGTNLYHSFEEQELGSMWHFFEKADRIIGYNSESFDVPILNRYYIGDLTIFPHLDLLKVIRESFGKRLKLNDVAKATLQIEKSADGLQAQKWFQEGKINEIKKYCEQDVKVTKEIYDFGQKNHMLYYPLITGEIQPFGVNFELPNSPVNASGQEAIGINLTLPL